MTQLSRKSVDNILERIISTRPWYEPLPPYPPELERFLPIRVICRITKDGIIQGQIEHSFSMDWSDNLVNIWWSGNATSNFGGSFKLDASKDIIANHRLIPGEIFVDPLAEDSPIVVNWKKWLAATHKFDKRNAPFVERARG